VGGFLGTCGQRSTPQETSTESTFPGSDSEGEANPIPVTNTT
jgi:hypothetical protein